MKDVRNKTREEIAKLLEKTPRPELYDLIYDLSSLEPHFSPAEVAARRGLKKHTILKLCRERKIGFHVPTGRDYRIPLSVMLEFDRKTFIPPKAA
jgi:excisionase family DNA binding protein